MIPAPWVADNFYQWMTSRLRVPQRPNLGFTGEVGDIWYVFVAMALSTYVGLIGSISFNTFIVPVQAFLSWMTGAMDRCESKFERTAASDRL